MINVGGGAGTTQFTVFHFAFCRNLNANKFIFFAQNKMHKSKIDVHSSVHMSHISLICEVIETIDDYYQVSSSVWRLVALEHTSFGHREKSIYN